METVSSLSSDDVVEVRVVTPSESNQLLEFLLKHYYREEPLTVGCSPPQPDQADQEFLLSNIPNNTCLTLRLKTNGRIVAAVVAGSKDANEGKNMEECVQQFEGTKWGRILTLLTHVENKCNVCVRYGVARALHVHALGVDASLRGQSLGARLMKALQEEALKLGYPLISVDCTSVYSAQLMKRLGYDLINTLKYADYRNDKGEQLFQPPAPHESVQTFALKL